jgi:hypothetical protein
VFLGRLHVLRATHAEDRRIASIYHISGTNSSQLTNPERCLAVATKSSRLQDDRGTSVTEEKAGGMRVVVEMSNGAPRPTDYYYAYGCGGPIVFPFGIHRDDDETPCANRVQVKPAALAPVMYIDASPL